MRQQNGGGLCRGAFPYVGEDDSRGISTLCGLYFSGEYDEEVFQEYAGWIPYLEIFVAIIDGENGNFLHWPFEGAYMDQPDALMQVLKAIQTEYRKHLREMMKRS